MLKDTDFPRHQTVETEVDFRPPRGSDRVLEDRSIITGAIGAEADERDPGWTRRLGSLGRAKPKQPRNGLLIPRTPGLHTTTGSRDTAREVGD